MNSIKSTTEHYFKIKENNTSIRTELLAGFTTFSTMIYIIFVNPQILQETGMNYGSVMTATILSSALASLFMGLYANYPFALAPGMGMNAYFTYGIVLSYGYTWQSGLGICFISGVFIFLLNFFGIREKVIHVIPPGLRRGTIAGLGFFLILIGFKSVHFVYSWETLSNLSNPFRSELIFTVLGVIMIVFLQSRKIKGAFFLTILCNWCIGLWLGSVQWKGIFGVPPSPVPTFLQLDFLGLLKPQTIPIILSLVIIAIFDSAGTLLGLAEHGKFLDPDGSIPRAKKALYADAIGTCTGSFLGTAPFITYLESAAGITAGARTGLAASFVGILFLMTLVITPFASSIPPFATAPALIVLGFLMLKSIRNLHWANLAESIPGTITAITIPLTFSVSTGIALGFIFYPIVKLFLGKIHEVEPIVWILVIIFSLYFLFPS